MNDEAILQLQVPESLITCQICMETFESPRILPCQHTFCKDCVTSLIQKHCLDLDGRTKRASFPCPNCRRECKIRQKGKYTVEEHINKCFPESLLMKTIMDSKVAPVCVSASRRNGEAAKAKGRTENRSDNRIIAEENVFLSLSVLFTVIRILTRYKIILNHLIYLISHTDCSVPSFSPLSFKRVNHNFLIGAVFDICMATFLSKRSMKLDIVKEFADELNEISALESDMLGIRLLKSEPGFRGCDNFVMKDVGCQTSEKRKELPYSWIVLCVAFIISTIAIWHGS